MQSGGFAASETHKRPLRRPFLPLNFCHLFRSARGNFRRSRSPARTSQTGEQIGRAHASTRVASKHCGRVENTAPLVAMVIRPTRLIALALFLATLGCEKAPGTYAANCATPPENWGREKDGIGHLRTVQPIDVASDGSVIWNANLISDATLRRYMLRMSAMNPEPQVVLNVSPAAACDRVRAIRAIMDAAPICKEPHSLCSEGWNWKRWPESSGS